MAEGTDSGALSFLGLKAEPDEDVGTAVFKYWLDGLLRGIAQEVGSLRQLGSPAMACLALACCANCLKLGAAN